MKRFLILIPVVLALSLLCNLGGWAVILASEDSAAESPSASERIIVHFKPGVTPETMQQVYQRLGATLETDIPQIGAQVVKIDSSQAAAGAFSFDALGDLSDLVYIEPDYMTEAVEIPDDTDFDQQWGLDLIQAPEAWEITRSSEDVIIAVLDSGIDSEHPDLASKIVEKKNFSSSSTVEDQHGHGTHVAGIAAAIADNNIGIAGVACNASLMNVKVLGDNGSGSYSQIAQGIIWAADNGADVINLSLGGNIDSVILKQAIDYAWDEGVVVVVAAGNNGSSNPSYPAYYENSIAVAATDDNDHLYSFSNYGNWVDIAAPGSALSTVPGNSYNTMMGTSMASPFVSGLAGLLCAIATDTSGDGKINDEVREIIENTADDIQVPGTGSGRINAFEAVNSLSIPNPTPSPQPAPAPRSETFGLNRGNSTYDQQADSLQALRFQNTVGDGKLRKLELLFDDATPSGKVKMLVYSDENGRPGHLLVDGGEMNVKNGWVSTEVNLNLSVKENAYYWLVYTLSESNGVRYQSGEADDSHCWADDVTYDSFHWNFPSTDTGSNSNQYVMRATVVIR